MKLRRFFDTYSVFHMESYKEFSETGKWPQAFLKIVPEEVVFDDASDIVEIEKQISEAWDE